VRQVWGKAEWNYLVIALGFVAISVSLSKPQRGSHVEGFWSGVDKRLLTKGRICFKRIVEFNSHSSLIGVEAVGPGTSWSNTKRRRLGGLAATLLFQKPCLFYSHTFKSGIYYFQLSAGLWGVAIMFC